MRYIGIDPGVTGAVGFLTDDGFAHVMDTPVISMGTRHEYNIPDMVSILMGIGKPSDMRAYIEAVHAMPKNGSIASMSLGRSLGIWEGILSTLQIPYEKVAPQRWKKLLLADMGKDKNASRLRAMQLFPSIADLFSKKNSHGRAEALLIAEYGRRTH